MKRWTEIEPKDAVDIVLPHPDIAGPLGEDGKPCPWPWDPPQLKNAPLGQYHCPYCGSMVLAGMDHPDYAEVARSPEEDEREERYQAMGESE